MSAAKTSSQCSDVGSAILDFMAQHPAELVWVPGGFLIGILVTYVAQKFGPSDG